MRTGRKSLTALLSLATLTAGLAFASAPALAVKNHIALPFSPFGSFSRASRLAIDQSNGNVFVTDNGAGDVRVFDAEGGTPAGGVPSELTGAQTPAGSFGASPFFAVGIAVDNACYKHKLTGGACTSFDPANGDVYVADVENNAVDKFKFNGSQYEYVCQFTGFGFTGSACLKNEPSVGPSPTEVAFNGPDGVAVDREGNVYISDYESRAIYEFNALGEDIRIIPISPENVRHPADVALDSAGDIYVHGSEPESGVEELKRSSFTGEVESSEIKVEGGVEPRPYGLAFNETTGQLFIDYYNRSSGEFAVTEYGEGGEALSTFDPETLSVNNLLRGIAVDEATGDIYIVNANGTMIDVFGPLVKLPSATTGAASNVGPMTATVAGTVNPENESLEAGCEVQYGKTTGYGLTVPCSPAGVGVGAESVAVTANLVGMEASTLYHYRVVAFNTNGPNAGPDETLMTAPAVEDALTGEASELGLTSATLTGSLKPNGVDAHYYFQYGPTEALGSSSSLPPGTDAGVAAEAPASARVSGLQVNTVYYYRLVATNEFGTTYGQVRPLATLPNKPGVVSESASRVFPREALLGAVVVPENSSTTYHFAYGPTAGYGSVAPAGEIALGGGVVGLQALETVSGLQPGTTYHYAVVATNRGGSTYGLDETFTTLGAALPVVVTGGASGVSQNGASISGTVDPQGVLTSYEWDIGTDTTYGTRISGEVGSSGEPQTLTLSLRGLAAGTLYHYRLVATNTYGTVYGADETFTTPGFPTALLVSPIGAPLVPSPVFNPPSIAGASTISTTTGKAKPKVKRKPKPKHAKKGKAGTRGRKAARKAVYGRGSGR